MTQIIITIRYTIEFEQAVALCDAAHTITASPSSSYTHSMGNMMDRVGIRINHRKSCTVTKDFPVPRVPGNRIRILC
jgi:hypothetical protein